MAFAAQARSEIGGTNLSRQLTGFSDALGDQGSSINSPYYPARGAINSFFPIVEDNGPFEVRAAGITDPGVAGKQNQDDFFLWESEDRRCIM